MGKNPAFLFYPADWLNDINLQSCSLSAQGLFINLMCLMHQSEKYGFLLINGSKPGHKVVQKLLRTHSRTYQAGLKELISYGVLREDEGGVLYCKRMVKDQDIRSKRAAAGKLGGNPNLLNQKSKQKTTPSVSVSSSVSSSNIKNSLSEQKNIQTDISFEDVKIKPKKIFKESSTEFKLAKRLYLKILENNPGFKKPNSQKWSEHIDKMIRLDKRNPEDIENVVDWCQKDSFEIPNILSTEKLRKRFDNLFMKMNQGDSGNNPQRSKAQQRQENNLKAAKEFMDGYKNE